MSYWIILHNASRNIVVAVDHEIVTQAAVCDGPVCSVLADLFVMKVIAER